MTAYRLIVRGELGDRFAHVFEGMAIERVSGPTVLILHALIEQVEELNLEIVSMQQTSDERSVP